MRWQSRPGSLRDRLAVLLALVTVVCVGSTFFLSKGTQLLMPGPLASAHGAIEKCITCHTKSGSGKVSFVHGLVAGDPLADSKACLTCHKMPNTAFNAHGATTDVLKQSTERLTKIAAMTPQPQSARAQNAAFPTHDMVARGLYCATCHQEHQGANFNLSKISNEQCRSCHVVKFDSFDGDHPKFENYPFKRRSAIIYDHAGHFGKHYPEVAKKDPARRIPETCSTCHNSREDRRVMAVAPFDQTCTGCHLNQITGKERATGPKGIAFLSLPGLDLQTLQKKNAAIGEWPEDSDAALTPFMKVMISRNEQGRALIKIVDKLNLQDLSGASDDQIKAVTELAWEVKGLFHALIKGKASDVLGNLNIGGGAKLSATLVADLTASIPRDVVIGAQQQWLPNLATEMAKRPDASGRNQSDWSVEVSEPKSAGSASTAKTAPTKAKADDGKEPLSAAKSGSTHRETTSDGSDPSEESPGAEERQADPTLDPDAEEARKAKLDPPPCVVRVFGECLMSKGPEGDAEAANPEVPAGLTDTPNPESDGDKTNLPPPMQAGLKELAQAAPARGNGKEALPANAPSQKKTSDQTDDLLFPTEEELRAIKAAQPQGSAGKNGTAKAKSDGDEPAGAATDANSRADTRADSDAATPERQTAVAPVISIQSDVDPESWAEYGGWYRQDYAIFYRPTGHKDKFIYSWLFLTGPQAPKGDTSPVASVFDTLTGKDAQGSCTKCHSVDDLQGKGRVVNFSPPSAASKQGRFTKFIHEPHFGVVQDRGCLTCHSLEKGGSYLKSYEQGNPQNFASSFGAVKKDLCQTCHTSSMARQDCLLCHNYHVNGVTTPIMSTKLPVQ